MVYKLVPPPPCNVSPGVISYSQAGEDAVLNFLFLSKGMRQITYLDIGTNYPDACNNTYFFYRDGGHGVCVEADATLVPLIKSKRPKDNVINAGVAVDDGGCADFYIFDCNGMNTFNPAEMKQRLASGKFRLTATVKVPLRNINRIIQENFSIVPDFLSLDIEGLDLDVLKTLDYGQYPIPVICVETCTYSENHIRPKDVAIAEFLCSKGYEIYADTYVNTIFVLKEWYYR
jgi:FkbM family methyltransferase